MPSSNDIILKAIRMEIYYWDGQVGDLRMAGNGKGPYNYLGSLSPQRYEKVSKLTKFQRTWSLIQEPTHFDQKLFSIVHVQCMLWYMEISIYPEQISLFFSCEVSYPKKLKDKKQKIFLLVGYTDS